MRTASPSTWSVLAVGVGLAIAARGITRIALRLGLGTPEDSLVFAAVFTALAVVGALALALPLARRQGFGFSTWAFIAALACLADLAVIGAITTPRGFRALCVRFGADASLAGTLYLDAAVALTAFALPALGIGATLFSAGRRVLALAAGAIAGWFLFPAIFEAAAGGLGSAKCVALGSAVACAAAFARASRTALLGVAGAAACVAVPITPILVLRPWERFPVEPLLLQEQLAGQWILEPREGVDRWFLDQRPLTPSREELALEGLCIETTLASVDARNVLLVGQATPERAALARAAGAAKVRWWAPWIDDSALPRLRRVDGATFDDTFRDLDVAVVLPIGSSRKLTAAARRKLPPSLPFVRWWPTDRTPNEIGTGWLIAADGVRRCAVGETWNVPGNGRAPSACERATTLDRLTTRVDERERDALRRIADARVRAADATDFDRGLAALANAQRASSPFEAPLERVELQREPLDDLFHTDAPDRFQRGVLASIAEAMRAQGEVPWVFDLAVPLTTRDPGWGRMQRVVAWAEAQELHYADAARRLEPFATAEGAPLPLRTDWAEALVRARDPRGQDVLRDLLRESPGDGHLFRLLAESR